MINNDEVEMVMLHLCMTRLLLNKANIIVANRSVSVRSFGKSMVMGAGDSGWQYCVYILLDNVNNSNDNNDNVNQQKYCFIISSQAAFE